MQRLFEVKKPPVRSHDYKLRKSDKRRASDHRMPRVPVMMSESDLDVIWRRIPLEDKARIINRWFSGSE